MEEQRAREAVVEAGLRLVKSGLIARTWGNVSCRLDAARFAITPSGRDYTSLGPRDIVPVKIANLSHEGTIKPSSEKGIHAAIYQARPDVTFIIHTHQDNASAISATALDSIDVSADYPELAGTVVCAAYGLPGTKALRRGVLAALDKSPGQAIIMRHHGTVCFGADESAAFQAASDLELAAKRYVTERYLRDKNIDRIDEGKMRQCALARIARRRGSRESRFIEPHLDSERTSQGFELRDGERRLTVALDREVPDLSPEAALHRSVYRARPGICHILHADSPDVRALSSANITMLPLLDDFAQIVGTRVRTVFGPPARATAALARASAVLLANQGALCCGATADDAVAVRMILEKNCRAYLWGALLGGAEPLGRLDCHLMRFVYLKKYSKQISDNVS